ncbi:uncharacterized protein CCOS01_08206 [Colletotrichum costaricense]|uniref:Uncharacterized protein n=1 Tax=Colletotrichum costaricense TaxID=1209916 RepID=A0AAJ0DZE9_9PEZI|nr:uncharacterized protein CCOS01_08206 [Colletotrichum costaricense]KAK1525788.1 hypothetical protein CCOS01_08206 [Colletotrichum costaricense]
MPATSGAFVDPRKRQPRCQLHKRPNSKHRQRQRLHFRQGDHEGKSTRIPRAPKLEAFRYLSPQAQRCGDAFFQFKTIFNLTLETKSFKILCLSFPNMPESLVQCDSSSISGKIKEHTISQNESLKYVQSEEFIMKLSKSLVSLSLTGDFLNIESIINLAVNNLKNLSGFGISVPNPNRISTYNTLKLEHSTRLEIFSHQDGGAPVDTSAWGEMRVWNLQTWLGICPDSLSFSPICFHPAPLCERNHRLVYASHSQKPQHDTIFRNRNCHEVGTSFKWQFAPLHFTFQLLALFLSIPN